MMAKIKQGTSFANAVNYVLNRDEAYILSTKGIRNDDKKAMICSFERQAQLRELAKPVAHISLNFSKENSDILTDRKMVDIAIEYMKKMGYERTQVLMVRHTDRDHPHCHLILNRVDFDGKRISDQNERVRNIRVTQELTSHHGLFVSAGKDNVKRHRLIGKERVRYAVNDALEKHLPTSKSWGELRGKLLRDGIGVEFKYNGSTDQVQGVKFTKDDFTFNGSKVDKKFSFSKIDYVLRGNERAFQQAEEMTAKRVEVTDDMGNKHHQSEQLGSVLGLFDLPVDNSYDPDEEEFKRRMLRKKKRGIRR